jgi:tetratricopeptide (TPR) repeat protein
MKQRSTYLKSALSAVALGAASLCAFAESPSDAFVADFTNAFEKRGNIAPDVKEAALARLKSHPSADSASRALRKFFPALDIALEESDRTKSVEQLKKLTETGDPFLSAEAHYAIGRRLIADHRHEEAIALFDKVAAQLATHSLRAGEAHYYLGVCQEKMLEKEKAIGTFETMLAFFREDVSNRLRKDAEDRVIQLKKDVDGSLGDVANHMGFSERKLGQTDSGERTQEVQEHIVSMLDELIAQAEKSPP